MTEPLRNVVVATDENFVIPTAVTLRSLATNDPGPFCIWILASGVSQESQRKIEETIAGLRCSLQWIDMASAHLGDTSKSRIGRATYFRLQIGDLLPSTVDRVLYMDSDMLVRRSLSELWTEAFESNVIMAVRSINYPSIGTYGAMDNWPLMGLDPRSPYFNAGLMMIDLHQWRHLDIGKKCFDFLASPLANGALADQEALNAVLSGRWKELAPKWNQQTPLLDHKRGAELIYSDQTLRAARETPAIVHFLSRPKPWQRDCIHPYRDRWMEVAAATSFAPVRVRREPLIAQLKWRIRRAASALLRGR